MRKKYLALFFFVLCITNYVAGNTMLDSLENRIISANLDGEQRYNATQELWQEVFRLAKINQLNPIPAQYKNHFEQAVSWAEKNGTPEQLAFAQTNLLRFIYHSRNTKETISKALELLLKIDSFTNEDRHHIYNTLSNSYLEIGQYQKYIELISQKYQTLKSFNPELYSLSSEKRDFANVYYKIKQYQKARSYYFKSLSALSDSTTLKAEQSSLLNDIALTFDSEQKSDSAYYYYNKALELAKVSSFKTKNTLLYKAHFINVIESAIANLDQSPANYNYLIHCLKKEANGAVLIEESNIYLSAWSKLGELHYKQIEYSKALFYASKIDSVFNLIDGYSELYINNIRLKAKIAVAKNQAVLGNSLFDRIKFLNDSIANRKSNDLIEIAAVIYETAEKEKEIQQQRLTLIEKNHVIQQERKKQVLFIISTFLLLLILFLFYLFTQKLKKQKTLIENQKSQLSNSLEQKEILLREVHHRVKNNLQTVSSILYKQAQKSSDKNVKSMMEEGQNRIKSMALIHQKLYQTDDFRNIDMKSYIEDLTNNILTSNQQTDTVIELELNLSETNFHIDVAIPLGLILNELLTNAYKYAFVGRLKGKVSVSITEKEKYQFEMKVMDNGIGLPENMKEKTQDSLGISLVEGLAWQLRGSLQYHTNQGSVFTILFTNQLNVT